MATLSSLKLSAAVKPASVPAVQLRRNKLVHRLWEQCELAKVQQAGTTFAPSSFAVSWKTTLAFAGKWKHPSELSLGGL